MKSRRYLLFFILAGVALLIIDLLVVLIYMAATREITPSPSSSMPPLYTLGPTVSAAHATPTPQATPGIVFFGTVRDQDGSGVEGVRIYRKYASYPGILVATTGPDGYYESDFYAIPGDEMITVWAEHPGYTFDPEYIYWRHYHGYEGATHDFISRKP